MTRPTKASLWGIIATILITLVSLGCGMNRRYANGQIHQLPHTDVLVEYASSQSDTSEIQQSASQTAEPRKQILTITYPHPSPKYNRKYAEVTLRREPSATDAAVANAISQLVTNPFKKQEGLAGDADDNVLRLTITREELEFLLRDLVADSYFDREDRSGGVDLSVTLGSRTTRKPWDRVASFDQLAQKVIAENGQRSVRGQAGKVIPAAAELLPPTSSELVDDPTADATGRLHRVPDF